MQPKWIKLDNQNYRVYKEGMGMDVYLFLYFLAIWQWRMVINKTAKLQTSLVR